MKWLLPLLILCGCTTGNGTRVYPVVGFGWVTVKGEPMVRTSTVIGLNSGSRQFGLGFSSLTQITVPTNSNVVIDFRK